MLPSLHTSRLTLRHLTEADVPALFTIFSNAEVMRYWSSVPMQDMSEARELLAHIHYSAETNTLLQWGFARRDDDVVIGTCTLYAFDRSNKRAEIGYALAREQWGRGYAGEAIAAVVRYAFDELGLERLEADVDPRNAASIRSLERLGFVREGYLRERWRVGGEVQDALFYGLLRREFRTA